MSNPDNKLEKIFKDTEEHGGGECPLPEPGSGAPKIEHPELIGMQK